MDVTSITRKNGCSLTTLPQGPGSTLELARDLTALGAGGAGGDARWLSRPAVLRRVALLLAHSIPAPATRIVVAGDGAVALGTAVSLTAGLPFAAADAANAVEVTFGEVHAGEDISLVAVEEAGLAGLRSWCDVHELTAVHQQCVFGRPGASDALFVVGTGGVIEEVTA